jgi:tetratricopeptide (TPR) repeat protein
MRARFLLRFAALLFLLAAGPSAWSQQQMGSILGIVRVVRSSFPSPVLVSLQLHGATIATCYTDSDGRFAFNTLPANLYQVVINDDFYLPFETKVEIKPDIQPLNILQVTLVPRTSASNAAAAPYVVSPSDFNRMPPKAIKEYERGLKMEAAGKPDDAIEHYQKAIKAAPDFAMAHNNLGSLFIAKAQFPEAQKELEESIRFAPADSKAYFNMANLMLLTGKLQDAERYLQDGFRKQPDSAFGLFVQGSVLERSGKLEDAERTLRRALQLDPKLTRPHLELVNVYLLANRPADAVAELRAFLQQAPSDPLAPKAREVLARLEAATPSLRK